MSNRRAISIDKPSSGAWIDISRVIARGMPVYPGDPPTEVRVIADERAAGGARVTELSMSAHAGTHVDAPVHYASGGKGVEALSFDALNGPAEVVEFETFLSGGAYYERVLLRNAREIANWPENKPFPWLIGTDAMSVGSDETHRTLLGSGVVVLEGLDLSAAPPGSYLLICLPVKIPGSDGAPARAVLWRDEP